MVKGLVVDIDDTLSDTTKYWIGYFQKEFGNPENYSIQEMYDKYHYVQNVPYWQSDYIDKLIYQLINSNSFQHQIPLIKNSNTILTEISKVVPIKCYLTKRPENVRNGTEFWMKKFNFPPAEIIFKPNNVKNEDGNLWKSSYIEANKAEMFCIIDDDENLIKLIERDRYIHLFLYGKKNIETPILRVHPCSSWEILKDIFEKLIDEEC